MGKIYLSYRAGKEGKIKRIDLGLLLHTYRSEKYGYKSHQNENIDPTKTHLNQYYIAGGYDNIEKAIFARVENAYKGKRKFRSDAVIAREVILQGSNVNPDKMDLFNRDCLSWLQEEFGKENVVGMAIHNDETSPHIHATIVPITKDGRISQKDFFKGPHDLKRQHGSFREYMSGKGWNVSLENKYEIDIDSLPLRQYKKHAEEINKMREEQAKILETNLTDKDLYQMAYDYVVNEILKEQKENLKKREEFLVNQEATLKSNLKNREKSLVDKESRLETKERVLGSKENDLLLGELNLAKKEDMLKEKERKLAERERSINQNTLQANEKLSKASEMYSEGLGYLLDSKDLLDGLQAFKTRVDKTDGDLLWDYLKKTKNKGFYETVIEKQKEAISRDTEGFVKKSKTLEKKKREMPAILKDWYRQEKERSREKSSEESGLEF